jgi:hypothetical protein
VNFDIVNRISHPASLVLETMIEKMEAIVPFLPNVESIETLEREPLADGRVRIVRRWQAGSSGAPAAVRPFLSAELLGWLDTALWTPEAYTVEWTHSTLSASVAKLYDCAGTNYFEPYPDDPIRATRIRITGELIIHPERLPGVVSFLGRTIAPQVERFVVGLITPNLEDLAEGLQRYLDSLRQSSSSNGT